MRRLLFAALLFFLPIAPVLAQAAPPAAISSATAGARTLKDLPYVKDGLPSQRLDLYLPGSGVKNPPLVVFIHGGGWQAGSKKAVAAQPLLGQGYAVASVEYRFSQAATYPAQIEDCKAAIRWLRAHAKEYGYNPEKIGVWGASAGGHLVALLGTTGHTKQFDKGENLDQSSAVQCVIDWFGPSDFLHWGDNPLALAGAENAVARLLGGAIDQKQENAKAASPVLFVQKDAAPFLIMHGDQDKLVPLQQSTELDEALKKAGVESTLQVIKGNGHGGPGFTSPESLVLMGGFLEKHLKRSP
jgi:acetyl esterase/lipase